MAGNLKEQSIYRHSVIQDAYRRKRLVNLQNNIKIDEILTLVNNIVCDVTLPALVPVDCILIASYSPTRTSNFVQIPRRWF